MKYVIKITLLLASIVFLYSSCNQRQNLKNTLMKFMTNDITIPDSLMVIFDGRAIREPSFVEDNQLIMYIDSNSCTSCRISSLNNMLKLYELAEKDGRFSVLTIFSPSVSEVQDVERKLKQLHYPYPLYIDNNNLFSRINHIPNDIKFHNFLINKEGKILCVGSPLENKQLNSVFMTALNNNN